LALITVDDLGDYLGQTLTSSDKATFVVAAADQIVKTLTEQHLEEVTDDVILMDGTGTEAVLLPELPVTEVSSVMEGDELLTENEDYVLQGDGELRRLPTVVDSGWSTAALLKTWTKGQRNLEITYTHGYSDLPDDLRMVALSIAGRLFNESAGNIISESLGQYAVRYSDTGSSDLNFTEKTVLRKYRVSKAVSTGVAVS
jgi:hypothetical protein